MKQKGYSKFSNPNDNSNDNQDQDEKLESDEIDDTNEDEAINYLIAKKIVARRMKKRL